MALHLGTGLIETRGGRPVEVPRLEQAVAMALEQLGWAPAHEGADTPQHEPEDGSTEFALLAKPGGTAAVRVSDAHVVRDLARLLHRELGVPLVVLTTIGSLFGRRSVEVSCRKFGLKDGAFKEEPVMTTHTAEVRDVEHKELRQAPKALRARISEAHDSLVAAEGSVGFELQTVFQYKRAHQPAEFSSPRLARLMEQVETCETFQVLFEEGQPVVKLTLSGGAKSTSYLKPKELVELESAIEARPEVAGRRTTL